jgi:hypothetical protein
MPVSAEAYAFVLNAFCERHEDLGPGRKPAEIRHRDMQTVARFLSLATAS